MMMSDSEILGNWRKSDKGEEQVRILAELNAVSPAQMSRTLRDLGVDAPVIEDDQVFVPEPRAIKNEGLMMELYRQGFCDDEIAEASGNTKRRVADWRKDQHLKANYPSKKGQIKPVKKSKEESTQQNPTLMEGVTVEQLAAILQKISQDHPGAPVTLGNGVPATGVTLTVYFDSTAGSCVDVRMV